MSKLSKYLINEIYTSLDNDFINSYNNLFNNKAAFKAFYNEVIHNYLLPDLTSEDVRNMKVYATKNLRRTKQRWLKDVETELQKNAEPAKYKFILKQINDYHNLINLYSDDVIIIDDNNKFIEDKLQLIKEWANCDNYLITEFIYLKSLTKNRIKKAFVNDLKYLIINEIVNKYNYNIHGVISERPQEVLEKPIFGSRQKLLTNGEVYIDDDNDKMLINEYVVEDDYIIRTVIKEKSLEKIPDYLNIKLKNFQSLDEKDSLLFDFVSSRRDTLFVTKKTVIVDEADVALFLYRANNKKARELSEKRALRLADCTISGVIKKKGKLKDTYFKLNLFDMVQIQTDEHSGKRLIEFIYTDTIYNQFLQSKTIKIYNDQIKNFENPLSCVIIYPLQQERFRCYKHNLNYKITLPYIFFRHEFRFKSKKKEANMSIIEASLQELKNHLVIVKDFARINNNEFEIELYPLSEFEIHDFIDNNNKTISENAVTDNI